MSFQAAAYRLHVMITGVKGTLPLEFNLPKMDWKDSDTSFISILPLIQTTEILIAFISSGHLQDPIKTLSLGLLRFALVKAEEELLPQASGDLAEALIICGGNDYTMEQLEKSTILPVLRKFIKALSIQKVPATATSTSPSEFTKDGVST